MSIVNTRSHTLFVFSREDEERMRNRFMVKNLCSYCEEIQCSGTSEIDCDSDHRHFYSIEEDQEEWEFGFFEDQ